MASKVKITVIKKVSTKDLWGDNPPCHLIEDWTDDCTALNVGDEFIVPEDGSCPDGFCGWAFSDMYRDITHLRYGGNYPWCEEGVWFPCCTDGLKNVIFKLERVD
ncbi:MAG: TIGR04076 family protein [Candidatus Thermoplasmatota archaeon]|nr:TIGR04076 family protein [Candidatus Thermoplasmatota archaeon]